MKTATTPFLTIVTGAAGGLGSALCKLLLKRNLAVLGTDHNQKRLEALADHLSAPTFFPVLADLESPDFIERLEASRPASHPLRGLVCTAAKSMGGDILNLRDEDWQCSFDINVTPAMRLARHCAPLMEQAGGGAIVNVGSPVSIVGARKPAYAASKAALTGLTVTLARNLGPRGIRANLLLPGPMITLMTEDWPEEKCRAIAESSFLKRLCDPVETAAIIAFLLSADASYLTGSVIDATAGSMFGH